MRRCTGGALLVANLLLTVAVALRCKKTPTGITSPPSDADGRFVIEVSGNPSTYVPGDKYTIFLRGIQYSNNQQKFTNFLLVAEHKTPEGELTDVRDPSVGYFQLYGDTLTVFNDECPNSISETNSLPKTDIQVLWVAPPQGSGCVVIKATVVESSHKWYRESGPLAKEMCEEERESDDVQPRSIEKCCACDEAKYEVAFEGLWSRNTHPKDFPDNKWLTRFSDIIGASHSIYYKFWDYGQMASDGLKELAENGNTKALESELKAKSDHIRTIIKARGISHPNTTARTFAVFRVDNRHHLMSLVSMIQPSPDWIVGVSGLELCLENCSWIDSKTFNLYPWDAGTDDGVSYVSEDQPSYPRQPIRYLKNENNSQSPFSDEIGNPLKPLARLILSRQRLYEKHCEIDHGNKEENGYCEVTDWGKWSCNAYCGVGMKLRQRAYKYKDQDYSKQQTVCKQKLTERAVCHGKHTCRKENEYIPESGCEMTAWGDWSTCSAICGNGVKTRSRRYKNRNAAKTCAVGTENPQPLEQHLECYVECEDSIEVEESPHNCSDRQWSEWSPCSSSCGKGFKVRIKLASPDTEPSADVEDVCAYIEEKVECYNDDRKTCDNSGEESVTDAYNGIQSANHVNGKAEAIDCVLSEWSKWSPCDCDTGFKYKTRQILQEGRNGGKVCRKPLEKSKQCNRKRCHNPFDHVPNNSEEDADCILSEWSPWTPCSQSCGPNAVQQRTRTIIQRERGEGRPCDIRFQQVQCFLNACLDFSPYF